MKTNEEFLEGIYGKRDALLKKRKKKMSVITTALCAIFCVAVTAIAGFSGNEEEPNKVVEIYKTIMKSGLNATQHEFGYANDEAVDDPVAEITTAKDETYANEALTSPEVYTKPAADAVTEIKIQPEDPAQAENVTEKLTFADEEAGEGAMNFAPELPETGADSEDAAQMQTSASKNPMPSTEEIVEAAYNALTEDVRQHVIKDSAEAIVTRHADGTQTYEVYFRTTQDQYLGIKLDSELNKIPFKGDE